MTYPSLTSGELLMVIPPDGGWGWVILVACFFINFVIDGLTYCFGIFLEDISVSLRVRPTDVAIAQSLMAGFYYFAGPLSCGLTNKFGFRVVGIVGTICSAVAFYVASHLNELLPFMIVIGIVGGISFNMIYTPCLLIIGFYFERWRALCTAISVTGTSVGITLFPLIMNKMLSKFDWRDKFRIISGICISLILLILTFKPIKPTRVPRETKVGFASMLEMISIRSAEDELVTQEPSTGWTLWGFLHVIGKALTQDASMDFISYTAQDTGSIASSRRLSIFGTSARVSFLSDTSEESRFSLIQHEQPQGCCTKTFCYFCKQHDQYMNRPMFRDDIFYGGSVVSRIPLYSENKYKLELPELGKSHVGYTMSVTRVQFEKNVRRCCGRCPVAFLGVIKNMLDFSLFRSVSFDMLIFSGFLSMVGMFSPYLFITSRAMEIGIGKEWGDRLLQLIGFSNTIGRIVCGVVCTLPHIDLLLVSYVSLFLVGLSTIASCYLTQLECQIAFALMFGFNFASFTALRSVVLTELVGLDKLTNSFGIMIMFYGLACFIGTPLAGILQNMSGSYQMSFLFTGVVITASAVILMPVKWIHKREQKKIVM